MGRARWMTPPQEPDCETVLREHPAACSVQLEQIAGERVRLAALSSTTAPNQRKKPAET